MRHPTSYAWKSFTPEIFWNLEGFIYELFWYWGESLSTEKPNIWCPFLSKNFLATANLLEHCTEGYLHEMFRYCETKQFWRKNLIPLPILCLKIPDARIFLKRRGFRYEVFQYCETKNSDRKWWYPPIVQKVFSFPNFFRTPKCSPNFFFGNLRRKKNPQQIVISPISPS